MFFLIFKVSLFFFRERRQIKKHYPFFLATERLLRNAYRSCSPFKISKAHLQKKGEKDVHQYGETPLPVLAKIATLCGLKREDFIVDLGCGTGRGALFWSELLGCSVKGVDWIPLFIEKAQQIGGERATFVCEDIEQTELGEATVVYLYGTCLPEEVIERLVKRFESLKAGTKIITVSFSLDAYSSHFRVEKQFSVAFPWGQGDVFLNTLSANH